MKEGDHSNLLEADNLKFDDSAAIEMANLGLQNAVKLITAMKQEVGEAVKVRRSDWDSEALLLENETVRTNGSSRKEEQDDSSDESSEDGEGRSDPRNVYRLFENFKLSEWGARRSSRAFRFRSRRGRNFVSHSPPGSPHRQVIQKLREAR